jgi:hypothetical protein
VDIHQQHYGYTSTVTEENLIDFMKAATKRIGADELLTPREIIRDFIGILNILKQQSGMTFNDLLKGEELFKTNAKGNDDLEDDSDDDSAVFTL